MPRQPSRRAAEAALRKAVRLHKNVTSKERSLVNAQMVQGMLFDDVINQREFPWYRACMKALPPARRIAKQPRKKYSVIAILGKDRCTEITQAERAKLERIRKRHERKRK